jgi:hypothetical protein
MGQTNDDVSAAQVKEGHSTYYLPLCHATVLDGGENPAQIGYNAENYRVQPHAI